MAIQMRNLKTKPHIFSSVCLGTRFSLIITSHFIPECDIKIDLALVIDNSGSIADKNVKNETNHTIEDNYVTLKARVKPCSHHFQAKSLSLLLEHKTFFQSEAILNCKKMNLPLEYFM